MQHPFLSSTATPDRLRRFGRCLGALTLTALLATGASAGLVGNEAVTRAKALADKPALRANCTAHAVAVDGGQVYGELCLPATGVAPSTVQLLLHGITYTTLYWDFPYQPETYSYVRYMNDAGYATFNIDRLGYGASSHPLGATLTLDSAAKAASQIVTKLRAGAIGNRSFKQVILVGHSYGTATSWLTASQYGNVDAVIGTGWAHQIESEPLLRFFSGFYPAAADPRFSGDPTFLLDPGYLTGLPGGRNKDFLLNLGNADPKVIALDELTKSTVTVGEGASFVNRYADDHTRKIKVPTIQINGQQELFFCGPNLQDCRDSDAAHNYRSESLRKANGGYFSKEACFEGAVIPNAGHDLNLQRNARLAYGVALAFANKAVGNNGQNMASYRAACQQQLSPVAPLPGPVTGLPFSSFDLNGPNHAGQLGGVPLNYLAVGNDLIGALLKSIGSAGLPKLPGQ